MLVQRVLCCHGHPSAFAGTTVVAARCVTPVRTCCNSNSQCFPYLRACACVLWEPSQQSSFRCPAQAMMDAPAEPLKHTKATRTSSTRHLETVHVAKRRNNRFSFDGAMHGRLQADSKEFGEAQNNMHKFVLQTCPNPAVSQLKTCNCARNANT
eukprot:2262792-Amphidinium_carterae.1